MQTEDDTPRRVQIERWRDTWAVVYVSRNPRQRVSAAQFYAGDHTLEWVTAWVAQNPKLELVTGDEHASNQS